MALAVRFMVQLFGNVMQWHIKYILMKIGELMTNNKSRIIRNISITLFIINILFSVVMGAVYKLNGNYNISIVLIGIASSFVLFIMLLSVSFILSYQEETIKQLDRIKARLNIISKE
jgi:hypothetical protein